MTLTLTVSGNGSCVDAVDTKVLAVTAEPTANAGTDDEVCENTAYTVSDAAITNSAGINWTSDGNGVLTDANTITPTYTPDPTDAGTNVTLTLTVSGNGSCVDAVDTKVLTVTAEPTANAGADDEICVNTTFQVTDASVTDENTFFWSEDGDGSFDDPNLINPTYSPASTDAGTIVTLTLTATGNGSCATVQDSKALTITAEPTANAGADDEVCENTAYTVSDAAITNSAGINWTSDGNGVLTNATTSTPTYTPDPLDAGTNVTLTLTVSGNGSCVDAVDTKVLAVTAEPTANAGTDDEVCENTAYTVSDAAITNSAGINWTSDGNGVLTNATTSTPTYTPDPLDAGANVTLTLTVSGNGSCVDAVDTKVLAVTAEPTANAGADDEVCENTAYTVSDAAVTNSAGINWTSDGNGVLTNATTSTPTYTPDPLDAGANVTLTLTVSGNGSCVDAVDTKVLAVTAEPTANAGADDEVCENTAYTVSDAAVTNSAGINWTSDGNGVLTDANTITPTYTPDPTDAGTNVTLTLTVSGNGSCVDAVDTKVIAISVLPVGTVTSTGSEVCISEPITLGGTINSGASTGSWIIQTGQGSGPENSGTLSATANNSGTWESVFTPDGSYFGNVTFEFVANSGSSCPSDITTKIITIRSLPTVVDQSYTLCEDTSGSGSVNVNLTSYNTDVTTENQSNVTIAWFTNSSLTNPVLDETDVDINGSATYYARVTLNATNCFDRAQVDFTVNPQIVLTAGSDEIICDGDVLDLSNSSTLPSESNASTLLWTSNGDGSFNDDTAITPMYTPGPTDFANSPITLTLTASSAGPCAAEVDQMELTINPVPVIDPVSDLSLCPGDTHGSTSFSADISGGTFNWSLTNSSQLGISSSGTGNLPALNAQSNTSGAVITSVVTIDYVLNGCSAASETFNIDVKPTPVIDGVSNIQVCPGSTVNVNFNANTTGETFSWSNDNTAVGVGLVSNGSGDISFTAESNNTGAAITSNFTYSATLNGCASTIKTFTVTLLPKPVIAPFSSIEVCSFDNISTSFSSNVSGSTFSWTNDNTATGIAAAGNGNINVNASENLSGVDQVSNITVTATRNGCISEVETFTVTVKPKPILNTVSSFEICATDNISATTLSDNSGGASTISWTASNASAIGLPSSSGTGNIPAFTANSNNTTATIVSNVTVTSTWDGCVSDQINFQIRLKPTPIMNSISDDELCAGEIYSVNFGNSLGASTTYSWVNDNTAIGLAASGNGDNINFTANSNNSGSPIVANIIVTPTNNSCVGTSQSFSLTLNPSPVISPISDVELCPNNFISIPVTTDLSNTNLTLTVSDNSVFAVGPILNGQNIEFTTNLNTTGADITSNIEVTSEQNGCESSEDFNVTLFYEPLVSSEPDEGPLCYPGSVNSRTFGHDSGTGNFSWEVTNADLIGDATPTSGTGIFPGFDLADNQTGIPIEGYVKYFSERNGCLSSPDSFKITLKPSPIILNTDTAFCEGDFVNIDFSDNVGDDATYEWQIDNLTIGINNSDGTTDQSITPAGFTAVNSSDTEDNVANITVFSTIDGCAGPVKTIEVRVLPNPTLSNNILEFTTCSNDTFSFVPESSIPSTDFEWTYISGDTSVVQGVELSGTGDINLDLINTSGTDQNLVYGITPLNSNCIGTSEELTITVRPEIKFQNIQNEYFVCSGQDFELPITLTNNLHVNDIEYFWTVSENEAGANDSTATAIGGNLTNSVSGQRDTVVYTITPRLLDGTCAGNTEVFSVIINPNAIVEILPANDICEGENLTLEAQLLNGSGSGQWSGGDGSFTSSTSPITTYIPDESEYGENVTLRFTVNDPDGSGPCTSTFDEVTVAVNLLPNVAITGNPFPNNLYCIRNGIKELTGSPAGGIFTGRGVFEQDGAYFFNPETATVGGPYTITYEFTNSNGCTNSTETTVQVTNGPNSNFEIETDDSEGFFCSNAFLELDPTSSGGTFSGKGIEILGGISYFNASSPEVAGLDSVEITYTIFESETSCTAFTTKKIRRIPAPEIEIVYQNICDVDNAVQIFIDPGYDHPQDSLVSFQLEYENSPNRIYEEGQIEQFSSPGVKSITIVGTTALGCTFEKTTTINVGNIQKTDFSVNNLKTSSNGQQPTQFTNQSMLDVLNGDPSLNLIESFQWDFGVEGVNTDISILENPSFNYENAGAYDVKLVITSSLGCTDSIIKTIDIVPAVDTYPYLETFDQNSGGWYSQSIDTISSSWIHDFPNGAFVGKNDNPNPGKIWKTATDGISGYKVNENSFLYSPTFDLTSLEKPMIAFDMWLDVEDERFEGAILEYSTDGENWFVFGSEGDELNWYNISNRFPIGGQTSNEDAFAWYFTENQRNWIRVAHSISEDLISNFLSVSFRINFRGDRYSGTPIGMAIDNIYVGERQKLVLLESFTNLNSANYINNRSNVEDLVSSEVGKDVLPMNFHISLPSPDSINIRNSVEMDARASIYDVDESPTLIIDGELFEGNIFESPNLLNSEFEQIITRRSLLEPSNLIEVSIDETANENTIRFDASLSPNNDTTINLIGYYFIIEKSIDNTELTNIVRKILPNINGVNLDELSENITNTYEWEVNSIYSNDDLAIVSIVQDKITNRIFEINIDDVNQAKYAKVILNINEGFESIGMNLYPNPSRGNLNIRFAKALNSDIDIMILDSNGKIIKTSKIPSNTTETELDLSGFASGVYHVISKNSNGDLNRQKIVLID